MHAGQGPAFDFACPRMDSSASVQQAAHPRPNLEVSMTLRSNSPAARDIAFHLHSYTNARKNEAEGSLVLTSGKGVYVYDDEGKAYLEGLSGLWCLSLGYGEERLVEAAARQMRKLPY